MTYKITIFHNMLVVYSTIRSPSGGCIYKRVDVMAVRAWCQNKFCDALNNNKY